MDWEPVRYRYATSLRWTGQHKGDLSCEGKPTLNVACPPEWGGHPGIWSPEDLFVGSLEVCTLTTFLFLLDKLRGRISSYESSATGTAQMVKGDFVFKDIVIKALVKAPTALDAEKAGKVFSEIGKLCLITKSVNCEVRVEPEISVG